MIFADAKPAEVGENDTANFAVEEVPIVPLVGVIEKIGFEDFTESMTRLVEVLALVTVTVSIVTVLFKTFP